MEINEDARKRLAKVLFNKYEELLKEHQRGGSFGPVTYLESQGTLATGLADIELADGSCVAYFLEARVGGLLGPAPRLKVKKMFHSNEDFWENRIRTMPQNALPPLIIDNVYYTVKKDSIRPGQGDGFGGREFTIWVNDKKPFDVYTAAGLRTEFKAYPDHEMCMGHRVLTTRNLWAGGTIPPVFRDRLPNNATLAK
jgi:hypothetical protein